MQLRYRCIVIVVLYRAVSARVGNDVGHQYEETRDRRSVRTAVINYNRFVVTPDWTAHIVCIVPCYTFDETEARRSIDEARRPR